MSKESADFTWLHLSDLHIGMSPHRTLWPNIKHEFYKDLEQMHKQTGGWDAVIFSGDLTQKGSEDEYQDLLNTLVELWRKFRALGSDPLFFHVPGNHDLVRLPKLSAEGLILSNWWENSEIQSDFWNNKKSQYKKVVNGAFANYEKFSNDLISTGIPLGECNTGALPGDKSTSINIGAIKVGLLGLNSTWLQLGEGDYEQKLSIDLRQIIPLAQSGTIDWCESNDINLIITHHPKEWLHPTARQTFDSELSPPGRFDAHLFGHMHNPDTKYYSHGGSELKIEVQAASLFGLEFVGNEHQRIHGYSVGQISLQRQSRRIKIWPRTTMKQRSGQWKIVPDHQLTLDSDNSYSVDYKRSIAGHSASKSIASPTQLGEQLKDKQSSSVTLNNIYYALNNAEAHLFIRGEELQKAVKEIAANRCIWLISEWGMGGDGFLWAIKNRLEHSSQKVYSLDLGEYKSSDDFLDSVLEKFGCSFAQLCNYLSSQGDSYLILSDIPGLGEAGEKSSTIATDIEEITKAILQYCVGLKVILKSRHKHANTMFLPIELLPLDQAETLTYIQNHSLWIKAGAGLESASEIYSLSDGAPQLIDATLSDLEYASLPDLVSMSTEISSVVAETVEAPKSLVRIIRNLADANDAVTIRAYKLLKALCVFPNGERLDRVRNFEPRDPFHAAQARTLAELCLIDSTIVVSAAEYGGQNDKTLIARRVVRDYILSLIGREEYIELCKKAVSLYFGNSWLQGKIKGNPKYKFDSAQTSSGDVGNANKILKVLFIDAISNGSKPYKTKITDVCAHFLSKLSTGSHYREIKSFCEGLIPYIQEENDPFLLTLKFQQGKASRMVSSNEDAKQVFLELTDRDHGKAINCQILLNLALCHEVLGEHEEAMAAARKIKTLNPGSSIARYAEAIIVENNKDEKNTIQKLSKLEDNATAKKEFVAANNIALTLAEKTDDISEKIRYYNKVLTRARVNRDDYNAIRACVNLSLAKINAGSALGADEEQGLIRAYHYLYNQRLGGLFNKCHQALWHVFQSKNDYASLVRLFRHSSLVWRLGGQDKKELEYIKLISKSSGALLFNPSGAASNELTYVLNRTSLLS